MQAECLSLDLRNWISCVEPCVTVFISINSSVHLQSVFMNTLKTPASLIFFLHKTTGTILVCMCSFSYNGSTCIYLVRCKFSSDKLNCQFKKVISYFL